MPATSNYIEVVGKIVQELDKLGLTPVLIGGMALVILGSRRVTKDFDFLISAQALEQKELKILLTTFYKKGFELASKIDSQGNIVATMDNQRIAEARLRLDSPSSVHFLNRQTGLQIDLLFDFPLPTQEIASRAEKKKIRSYSFRIASKRDLLRLKEIAQGGRTLAADVQDLEFLRKLLEDR